MTQSPRLCPYLLSRDLATGQRFYAALCGYSVLEDGPWYVVLGHETGAPDLALVHWLSEFVPRAARGEAQGSFLELVVDDVAAALEAIAGFEVEIIEHPLPGAESQRAVLRDIDGHVIALATPEARFTMPPRKTVA